LTSRMAAVTVVLATLATVGHVLTVGLLAQIAVLGCMRFQWPLTVWGLLNVLYAFVAQKWHIPVVYAAPLRTSIDDSDITNAVMSALLYIGCIVGWLVGWLVYAP
jgi:hypothetical protein